jgi:outer membrane protein TolC
VVSAFYALEAATKSIDLAKAEEDAAQKAFKLVQKKYSQGQANLVEWTNARTQKTTAEQKQNIAKYEYQICLAEFERAMGE